VASAQGPDEIHPGHASHPERRLQSDDQPVWQTGGPLGRCGVAALVVRCSRNAQIFATLVCAEPGIEVLNDVVFNQVAVRFGDSDDPTHAVISAVQAEGTCWAGGASWHGKAVMRWSVSNWSTTPGDIDRSAQAVINAHRAIRSL
jgi:glutamate/tyrosine decarboxylase-like PLP-dependent enzyme